MSGAQQRAEDAAHNISNIATPGYRAKHSFSQVVSQIDDARRTNVPQTTVVSMESGQLSETGNVLDLAISGEGFFELRDDSGPFYTRNGQFSRADDGRLLGVGGRAVQGVGGGDLILPETEFSIAADGSVMADDQVVARVAVMSIKAGSATAGLDGLLSAPPADVTVKEAPVVRQRFLESSNVSLGDEMIALMEAVRRAETGQRLMNVYDDLMGRVITSFGQAS